jgi:uncharacterized protein (DUF2236 family)
MAWRVHADLASMLFGGFCALMLQTLHPLAMAGVAGHSNFREDPTGRLRRTARFVAGTTFGGRAFVDQLVSEVRAVHSRVVGFAPDGRPYSASDPALLTWVHTTEAMSFLASYQRYGPRPLLRGEKDQYFAETAAVAHALGALEVPSSLTEARDYMRRIRPELAATDAAFETVRFVSAAPDGPVVGALAHRVVVEAAIDLLPHFAKVQLALGSGARLAIGPRRAAAHSLATTLRWALGPSLVLQAALGRVGARADPVGPPTVDRLS